MKYETNNIFVQVIEVQEVDSAYECDQLLNSGNWVFLNSYVTLREIDDNKFSQDIKYCLGRIN